MIQNKILEFIESIKNKDGLKLTSTNCGIFAILLKRIFNVGELVAIVGDLEPKMVRHVMLEINDKYYDAQDEWTKEEIIRTYEKINRSIIEIDKNVKIENYDIIEIDEERAEKSTEPTMTVVDLITMLKF
jgi:hypothetical protein